MAGATTPVRINVQVDCAQVEEHAQAVAAAIREVASRVQDMAAVKDEMAAIERAHRRQIDQMDPPLKTLQQRDDEVAERIARDTRYRAHTLDLDKLRLGLADAEGRIEYHGLMARALIAALRLAGED